MASGPNTTDAMLLRSPSLVLKIAVALAALLVLLSLYLVLRQPWLGLALRVDPVLNTVVIENGPALPAFLQEPRYLQALRTDPSGTVEVFADDLVEEPDLLGSRERITAFFARQSLLDASLRDGPVELVIADVAGNFFTLRLDPAQRPVFSLPFTFWVQALVAVAGFLTGCWIWSLRRGDWGPRCFFAAGIGIMIAALSAAVYSSRELALDGNLFKALWAGNFLGTALFGAGMIGLFLSYPKRLVKTQTMLWASTAVFAFAVLHVLELYGLLPRLPGHLIFPQIILVEMAGIVVLVCLQWLATHDDPASRAVLRWLGLSIVLCCGLFVGLYYIPVILQFPLVVPQGYSFVFFLLILAGIALGLRRYRLFDLGTWAFRFIFYLSALIGFLLLDGIIVTFLQLGLDVSTGIALLVIGFGYLPLRDRLWRLTIGRTRELEENCLMEAMDIPFSTLPNEASRKWRQLLQAVFDPLQILDGEYRGPAPVLQEEGLGLRLPATATVPAVTLRFCLGGERLFNTEDLRFVNRLIKLLTHAETSRDAYERGRLQERQRIAQDLHDDIGASLLTTLHSNDLASTRSNIRRTIADLRAVVGGLVGTQTALSVLIPTLRFEASTRLEETGIELDWPIAGSVEESTLMVDYRFTKNLGSILREIISNILVHSKAGRVGINTALDGDALQVTVRDDGVGMAGATPGGNGLANIRARTAALNGTVEINDTGTGLLIRMEIPLRA